MSKVVEINSKQPVPRVTPPEVARNRVAAKQVDDLGAWVSLASLAEIQCRLGRLLALVEAVRTLPSDIQDKIEALGGLDHEAVFDEAFGAHFELSVAEETLGLLKAL